MIDKSEGDKVKSGRSGNKPFVSLLIVGDTMVSYTPNREIVKTALQHRLHNIVLTLLWQMEFPILIIWMSQFQYDIT